MKRVLSLITLSMALTSCVTPAQRSNAESARVVDVPAASGDAPREVHVMFEGPTLKLVSIVLRNGTPLPAHTSTALVTIVAVEGQGTVISGAARLALDPQHAVVLPPNAPHAVEPNPGTDLVLVVHHVKNNQEKNQ